MSYADDSELLSTNKNWIELLLNYSKTNHVLFIQKKKKNSESDLNFAINSCIKPIEVKNVVKYVGVIINNKFISEKHIQYVLQKLSTFSGIEGKIRHFTTISILKNVHFAIAYL